MRIQNALEQMGGKTEDIIRTRIFVKNIKDWEKIGKAHHEFFAEIKPASTMIEVAQMIHPQFLVEIEATAMVSDHN